MKLYGSFEGEWVGLEFFFFFCGVGGWGVGSYDSKIMNLPVGFYWVFIWDHLFFGASWVL